MSAPKCQCYVDYRLDLGPYIIRCDLHEAAEKMFQALEHVEAVYRLNVVAPGEPSSTLENIQTVIRIARGEKVPG